MVSVFQGSISAGCGRRLIGHVKLFILVVLACLGPAMAPFDGGELSGSSQVPAMSGSPGDGTGWQGQGPPAGWLDSVGQEIQGLEYHFSPLADGTWAAPNRAQDFRSDVTQHGIEIRSRSHGEGARSGFCISLDLAGAGRGRSYRPAGPGRVESENERLTVEREFLTEWYVNTPRGLEQGFTIPVPPVGDTDASGGTSPLVIELAVSGGLRGAVAENGRSILFSSAAGVPVVRYAELVARDAADRDLEAWLELGPEVLRIVVDDGEAAYPIEIDPLLTSPAWVKEVDQAGASFGYSPWTAGDVNGDGFSDIVVGAPYFDNPEADEGRAFVYHGSASGPSTVPDWTAEGNQAGANFGVGCVGAGDVDGDGYGDVIIGARHYTNGEAAEGRAYLFLGSSSGLLNTPDWTFESDNAGAELGWVATAGDVNHDGYYDVIIGAPNFSNGEASEGRAFVFYGSSAGLRSGPDWTYESNQAGAALGNSVNTAGDVNGDGYDDVFVGAYLYDNPERDEGRSYVFHGGPGGLGSTPDWTAEGNQVGATLNYGITAGDVNGDGFSDLIVGAHNYDDGETNEGKVFVYLGSASGLGATPAWSAQGNQAGANFGGPSVPVDVNGDGYSDVLIGAHLFDNGQTDEGRAWLYYGSASGLGATPGWTTESNQAGAWLGWGIGCAGDVNGDGYGDVLVGAQRYDNGQMDEGRVWLYYGSPAGLAASSAWSAESNNTGANYGHSVSTAGDVNGDGYSDIIVGAAGYTNPTYLEGSAYVYHGSPAGPSTAADWFVESNYYYATYGYSVSTAGDVNGDGYTDVMVGAPHYDRPQMDEGVVFLYFGHSWGLSTTADWTGESNVSRARFGSKMGSAGDVNCDGYSDITIGATEYTNGQWEEGAAYVFYGSASGPSTTPDWKQEGNQASCGFYRVAGAGDVNGDGYSDLVVGAAEYDGGQAREGKVFVYHGSAAGLATTADWTAEIDQAAARFGCSVASAGDVDGDGYSDIVIGAMDFDNSETDEGAAFLFLGSSAGLQSPEAWTAEGNQDFAQFGWSARSAGDVNGDGYSDVIVGAPGLDAGETDEGKVFVYYGSGTGLPAVASWTAEANQGAAAFGYSVSTAGDVNGDGFSDVMVSAVNYDNGQSNEGAAFLYYGNEGDGLDRIPRQARSDDSALIDVLGRSDSSTSFRLDALGRTPLGRDDVRLEFEVKSLGSSFDYGNHLPLNLCNS